VRNLLLTFGIYRRDKQTLFTALAKARAIVQNDMLGRLARSVQHLCITCRSALFSNNPTTNYKGFNWFFQPPILLNGDASMSTTKTSEVSLCCAVRSIHGDAVRSIHGDAVR